MRLSPRSSLQRQSQQLSPDLPGRWRGHTECVKLLISASEPLAEDSRALRLAARKGRVECLKILIPVSDPNADNSYALRWAAGNGHAECVKLLIPISKPKINSSAALYFAAANGHSECVKLLIPASDPKAEYSRALLISAQRGHLECVLPLLPVSDHLMSRFTLPPLMLRNNVPLYSALDCGRASVFSAMLAHEPRLLGSLNFPALLAESISLGHADLSALLASIIEQKELSSTLPVRASAKSSTPGRL